MNKRPRKRRRLRNNKVRQTSIAWLSSPSNKQLFNHTSGYKSERDVSSSTHSLPCFSRHAVFRSQPVRSTICEQQLFDFSVGKTTGRVTEETERQPHQRIHSPPIDEASVHQTYAGAAIQLQNNHLRIARQQGMVMWWVDLVRFLQSSGDAGVRLEDALTQLPNMVSQIVVKLKMNKINSLNEHQK